jgi:hypothetical protein
MQTILSAITADEQIAAESTRTSEKDPNAMETDRKREVNSKPQHQGAKIGEGKAGPLTKNQRRRALYVSLFSLVLQGTLNIPCRQVEQFRQPLIRSNPEFASNPFQTIRTHAQNTLIKHRTPT